MKKPLFFVTVILLIIYGAFMAGCVTEPGNGNGNGNGNGGGYSEPPRYPFPQGAASLATYAVKPKMPDNLTTDQMTDKMIDLLKAILENNLIFDSRTPYTKDEFRIVFEHHTSYPTNGTTIIEQHITVSESHGYGMMILALMAGCEDMLEAKGYKFRFDATSLKDYYDGMVRTLLSFKSSMNKQENRFQMSWELFGYNTGKNDTRFAVNDNNNVRTRGFRYMEDSTGSPKIAPFANTPGGSAAGGGGNTGYNNGGTSSATDGDMDIIYSLILADKQWGSAGAFNYKQIALDMMNAFCGTHSASVVNPVTKHLKLGDWANNTQTSNFGRGARPSDFILSHLKAYKAFDAAGGRDWQAVIDSTYTIIGAVREHQASIGNPDNGLLPDFVVHDSGDPDHKWKPANNGFLEGNDDQYGWNSCRIP